MSQEYISCFFLVMILNFSSSVSSDTFEIPFNISTVLSNFKLSNKEFLYSTNFFSSHCRNTTSLVVLLLKKNAARVAAPPK